MAYRKLEDGDLVRIVDGNIFHGRNAVVVDSEFGKCLTRVQIERWLDDPVEYANILTGKLIVRNDPFNNIVDGKIDLKSKDAYEKQMLLTYRNRKEYDVDEEEELEEACGECECCKWHNRNY